jgi:hypothetical protein
MDILSECPNLVHLMFTAGNDISADMQAKLQAVLETRQT